MQDFGEAFGLAFRLVLTGNADLLEIIGLSLQVSLSAVLVSLLVGLPLGAALAVFRFPGRHAVIVVVNALMGLPPVVVGLLVYLSFSNAGPFGWLELLYTPTAMIVAQTVATFVKSRDWVPSPWTSIVVLRSAASTKAGTTAA